MKNTKVSLDQVYSVYLRLRHILSQANELEWEGKEVPDDKVKEWNQGMDILEFAAPYLHDRLKEKFLTECPPWVVE